ncbi:MAG: YobI family P-loop NTPase [Methylobacter sp.]
MIKLNPFINGLINTAKKIPVDLESSSFTHLTPIDDIDEVDPGRIYSKAISYALENPNIKNIALSGPYGSGKSSIIRAYEKNNSYKFLNISLASFNEEGKNEIDPILIERSILQQMLYGADADKLPYSRFKRISVPTLPEIKALFLVLWAIVVFFLYHHKDELLNLESYSLTWLVWVLLVDIAISLPVILISDLHKASFGISLKKISLINAEIETGECSENSILNHHLDEIIYFFQQTKYDVVVIEDLDRFGNPEIFVKLREINKLINDNKKASTQVRFLYALKDDMFAHKNRAKFFDFIIPVVPVINSSNSLDKMLARLKEHDFAKSINAQFLREVSFYIDDLRLIHNIFNEFVVYYERLKSENLDVTKLLAMMIYKNVYPNDFESLHHGKGALFEICQKKSALLLEAKKQLKEQQEEFRTSIKLADTEKARSIRELIDAYIGHIVMYHANQQVFGIVCNNQHIGFSQLTTFDQFKPLISEKSIQLALQQYQNSSYRILINKSFSQIEEEINPGETFLSRKQNIENNVVSKKIKLQKKVQKLEKEINELSQLQLFHILKNSDIKLDELIYKYEIADGGLLKYLVNEGYLDENYHLYISNFHEGRLTKNDWDYLLTIRSFNPPEPNQKIDTPKEVCANMRAEDFGYKYVLNVNLIDYLLENKKVNSKHIDSAIGYISKLRTIRSFFYRLF